MLSQISTWLSFSVRIVDSPVPIVEGKRTQEECLSLGHECCCRLDSHLSQDMVRGTDCSDSISLHDSPCRRTNRPVATAGAMALEVSVMV